MHDAAVQNFIEEVMDEAQSCQSAFEADSALSISALVERLDTLILQAKGVEADSLASVRDELREVRSELDLHAHHLSGSMAVHEWRRCKGKSLKLPSGFEKTEYDDLRPRFLELLRVKQAVLGWNRVPPFIATKEEAEAFLLGCAGSEEDPAGNLPSEPPEEASPSELKAFQAGAFLHTSNGDPPLPLPDQLANFLGQEKYDFLCDILRPRPLLQTLETLLPKELGKFARAAFHEGITGGLYIEFDETWMEGASSLDDTTTTLLTSIRECGLKVRDEALGTYACSEAVTFSVDYTLFGSALRKRITSTQERLDRALVDLSVRETQLAAKPTTPPSAKKPQADLTSRVHVYKKTPTKKKKGWGCCRV